MKAVILAGGYGSRLSEETASRPKPMIEIGGQPILWHVMKIYSAHGINDFVICLGYKGYVIKEYFSNYFLHNADVTFDIANNRMETHQNTAEPWRVTLLDTGIDTMTGGRLRRVRDHVGEGTFCLTYGDGVGDVDIAASIEFHRAQGTAATVCAVLAPGRFGALSIDGDRVAAFAEKPAADASRINGGFFVLEPTVFDLLDGDDTIWERAPLETLSQRGELASYVHDGFWHPMDTLRDKRTLEELWAGGTAPWKIWE